MFLDAIISDNKGTVPKSILNIDSIPLEGSTEGHSANGYQFPNDFVIISPRQEETLVYFWKDFFFIFDGNDQNLNEYKNSRNSPQPASQHPPSLWNSFPNR